MARLPRLFFDCCMSGPRSKQDGNGASAPTFKPEGDKRTLSADSGANNIISDYFNHLILQAAPQGKSEIVNALMALSQRSQAHECVATLSQNNGIAGRTACLLLDPPIACLLEAMALPAQSSSQKAYRNGTCAGLSGWKAGARQALYFRKQDHGAIAGRAMF
ncbi:hypothetical protein BX070DRAFT_235290 [Coemansia spiralis]|nr:hypothetical protein BX070DRAFT_235290 [Coemansia spiralis]